MLFRREVSQDSSAVPSEEWNDSCIPCLQEIGFLKIGPSCVCMPRARLRIPLPPPPFPPPPPHSPPQACIKFSPTDIVRCACIMRGRGWGKKLLTAPKCVALPIFGAQKQPSNWVNMWYMEELGGSSKLLKSGFLCSSLTKLWSPALNLQVFNDRLS